MPDNGLGGELMGVLIAIIIAAVMLPAFDPYTPWDLTLFAILLVAMLAVGAVVIVLAAIAQVLEAIGL
jgi:ABC-type polysaccharide/polyol phosphate export permease